MSPRLPKLNWAFAAGELVIVMVGILLALAIDDFRESRADRFQRAAWLAEVRREIVTDTAQLRRSAELQSTMTETIERLLSAAQSGAWPADARSIAGSLGGVAPRSSS